MKAGYKILFYGPSGSGKAFTKKAALLTGREVYRVDLSMVVSKYIGETEKNLELLFARAEDKDWILFFDEADAIFGKRTNVRDAHDKYANQEVSYLMQRIDKHPDVVILGFKKKLKKGHFLLKKIHLVITLPEIVEQAPDPIRS